MPTNGRHEWDTPEYSRLHDSDFSFETGSAQKRLQQYQDICFAYDAIENSVDKNLRPSLFEMLGYSTHSAFQMNRRFLYAQANHETGNTMDDRSDAHLFLGLLSYWIVNTIRYKLKQTGETCFWTEIV